MSYGVFTELEKLNKKEEELRKKRNQTSRNTGTSKTVPDDSDYGVFQELRKLEEQEEEYRKAFTANLDTQEDDIAPVKEPEERRWFSSGLFDDGYDFGDVYRTILGTGKDIRENLYAGVISAGEKAIDAGAFVAGGVGKLFGANEFADATREFIEKDLIDEQKVARKMDNVTSIGSGLLNLLNVKHDTDELSVLGEKSDSLVQSGGQLALTAGLQSVGVPWYVTTGLTSFGGETESALKQGATYGEAALSGVISAGAEILTEKISGGIKFGGKTLDTALTNTIARNISNQTVRTLTKLGMDMAGEGAEEVLSGVMSAIGQKITYADDKELQELFSSEDALEAFIGGMVLGGGSSGFSAVKATVEGSDYASGLTNNEKSVVDKVYKERVAEAEKEGKKLSRKDKNKIYDDVVSEMEKGAISTDTIEETLGGETYKAYKDTVDNEDALQKEFDTLNKMKQSDMTGEQIDRRAELKEKLADIKANSKRGELKTKLGEDVFNLVKGDRLAESYNERSRRKQAFEADLKKYDAKQQEVIKKAAESGILNNTRRTHEFVDMVAKISADKGVLFDFTNNAKLKESGFAIDGKTVNGFVTKDGVTLNIQSSKSLESVVGHEITHVLEGTELYTELQNSIFEYAKTKKDFQGRQDAITKLYEGIEGANIDAELTADLVGDYLFSDPDFISNLSTNHRNVFQKIYDEVKYLLKVATAGSKEARQLEKVKHAFEKAYKESAQKNTTKDGGVAYSLSEFTQDGRRFVEIDQEQSRFDGHSIEEYPRIAKDIINEKFNGRVIGADNKMFVNGAGRDEFANPSKHLDSDYYEAKMRTAGELDNLLDAGTNFRNAPDGADGHVHKDVIGGFDYYDTLFKIGDRYYEAVVNIKNVQKGKLFKDVTKIKDVTQDIMSSYGENPKSQFLRTSSTDIVSEDKGKVNPEFTRSDSTGRQLTEDQQAYFKDSKAVDENGNLKVMYHGTPNGDFTVFKDGTYFTDNKAYADRYQNPSASSISSGKTASNPKTFEVYLNIKKPFDINDAEAREIYINEYIKGGNAMGINPYLSDSEYEKIDTIDWTEGEDLRDFLIDNEYDYDGLILDEGADGGYGDAVNYRGTSYVVFSAEQIKSVDNKHPTSNSDIRRSLSAEGKTPNRNRNRGTFGSDIALEQDIAPVAESAATNASIGMSVAEMFPDDTATAQEEYEFLLAERDDLRGAMDAFAAIGDMTRAEQLMPEYEAVQARIAAIESDESDRLASIDEADAPPEMDSYAESEPVDVADNIPLTKTLVNELVKEVKSQLSIPNNQTAEVRELIERYSNEEFPSKAHLYTEIAERFGTYTETYEDAETKGVKAILRRVGINVDDSIKAEIPDYANLMRSNFGKVRFSKEGLPVDVAYMDFQELLPGYFPENIMVPTDQLMRIIEVANMETTIKSEQEIDWETLEQVTDTIVNTVNQYKQGKKEMLANKHGRESFQSLMEDAERYVPPIPENFAPVREIKKPVAAPDDIAPVYETAGGQQAFMPEEPKPITTRKDLHDSIIGNIRKAFAEKEIDFDKVLEHAKDLSTFATVDNTPQRVIEKALGYKEGQILNDLTVNQAAQNESAGIKWLNSFTDRKNGLLAKISKQYHIKPGSKASAAAQMYAEGFYVGENDAIIEYGDKELAADFPSVKMQENIKKLARDPRIRQIYDETLAAINESRTRNAYPEIPKLENYFLHFRAMEDTFSRLGLPFNPNDIRAKDLPTDLNGVTADLKPGQPYFASAMHRKGKRTSFDLLGGLEKYLSSAKNQIYHIDDIQNFRALRNYIADTYGQAHGLENLDSLSEEEQQARIEEVYNSHLSTFAKFLNEEANVLAGKTALIDRGLEGIIGRRGITFLDTVNRQVGSNMVGFNISSAATNFISVAQAFAKSNKFDFVKALAQFSANKVGSVFGKNDGFADNSPVMIRRKGADRFYRTPYQKISDAGYVLMGAVDEISTEIIARTKYNELTRKGMDSQQAHFETDKWVSRLMGDRSLGQQPHLYNSKMLGIVTKFQLEVRNQLDSQFYDTIQEAKASNEDIQDGLIRNAKTAAKITSTFFQLAVVQHLFGKAFESVAGYNPAFDIIEAIIKAFGFDDEEESEDTVLDNIEQGFLELMGDLPYTSTLTGGRVPISSALPVEQFFTGKDSYGNEKSRWETLAEAAPYWLMPGGYNQIKKTTQGLNMFSDEHPVSGSYTDSGNLRFPVEDTPLNRVQAALFGQWANKNAKDYFDGERAPLKKNQIQEFADLDIPIQDYWKYRDGLSEFDTLAGKVEYINSLDLPIDKKNLLVNNIADRKVPIDLTDYNLYADFEEFDYASTNLEKYAFMEANGVSFGEYKAYDEEAKKEFDAAYTWVTTYPEKVTVSKAVTDNVLAYRQYAKELNSIRADYDENGKAINGSAKAKKIDYINGLDLDYGAKIILFKSEYSADDTYNYDIVEYLNSREDISYDETVTILKELGFVVLPDGTVQW